MAAGQVTKFPKFPAARVPDSIFKALVPQLGEGGSPRTPFPYPRSSCSGVKGGQGAGEETLTGCCIAGFEAIGAGSSWLWMYICTGATTASPKVVAAAAIASIPHHTRGTPGSYGIICDVFADWTPIQASRAVISAGLPS